MHFIVHALDKPDALPRRKEVIAEHRAYLDTALEDFGITILMSGPLVEDDGETMKGSYFLLDAPDRTRVENLFANDPLVRNDVWGDHATTRVMVRTNLVGPLGDET